MKLSKSFYLYLLPVISHLPLSLANATVVIGDDVITGGIDNEGGIPVEYFKGIPYAQPPTGFLRFKNPVPYTGSYADLNASAFGYSCPSPISGGTLSAFDKLEGISRYLPQYMKDIISDSQDMMTPMNEDCLTVNVFRPHSAQQTNYSKQLLPVMVWIYGGAFQVGSSSMYDGGVYVRSSIEMDQPVILVTFNYRLGAFGFLGGEAVQEDETEGEGGKATNSGLMDQRLALQWVSKYIEYFGGDPGRVTLFGESAGAMSIAAHMAMHDGDNTYNGKPLFSGAILQSGAIIPTGYVDDPYPEEMFWRFAKGVGCYKDYGQNNSVVMECLRNATLETIMDVQDSILGERFGAMDVFLAWSPRSDRNVFSAPIHQLFAKGKFAKIPTISGNQQDEGTMFGLLMNTTSGPETRDLFNLLFRKASPDQIKNLLWLYPDNPCLGAPFNTHCRNIVTSQFKRISAFLTDFIFHSGRRLILQNTPANSIPTFVYHAETLHNVVPVLGTFHASDLIWQWRAYFNPTTDVYRRYFVAFANYGDPNIGIGTRLPHWERYTPQKKQVLGLGIQKQIFVHQQEILKPTFGYQISDTYRGNQIAYLVNNYADFIV